MDITTISILTLIAIGLITFVLQYNNKKTKNPNANNTELILSTLQPIVLDVLNDIIRFDIQVKDKRGFYEFWIQYVVNKLKDVDEFNEIEKEFITVDNVKLIAEPILDQIYNMGRKDED